MSKLLILITSLFLFSCSNNNNKHTYVYTNGQNGMFIRTEMHNGSANGRIITYSREEKIMAILHVKDSVLNGDAYRFYDDSRIQSIEHYLNGRLNGHVYEFYRNGQVSLMESYSNDKKNGKSVSYYPSGELKSKAFFLNGLVKGDYCFYYNEPKNHLRRQVQYTIVKGKQWGNGHIDYDTLGRIVNRQDILSMVFNRKYYRMSDTIHLKLVLLGPRGKLISATIYDCDSLFNKYNHSVQQVIYGHNHAIILSFIPKNIGVNYIRGYVSDYDSLKSHKKGALYEIREKSIYFQGKYIVR